MAWSFEYLHLCHRSKKETVTLKLDFEKAFDKIEHEVILQLLEKNGVPTKWIQWIKDILTSRTSIARGGHAGRSLIPSFVLATDLLQSIINKAKET
jgi:hypothetical protein